MLRTCILVKNWSLVLLIFCLHNLSTYNSKKHRFDRFFFSCPQHCTNLCFYQLTKYLVICIFKTNSKHAKILHLTVANRRLSLQTFFITDFLMIAMESNDITTVYLTDSDSRDVRLNHISGYPSLNGSSPK